MEIVGCFSVSVETFVEYSLTRNVITQLLPSNGLFHFYSLQRERVFGELLASNGLPFWLHYTGFQASCDSTSIQDFCDFIRMLFEHLDVLRW
jgi:hypothetical protein